MMSDMSKSRTVNKLNGTGSYLSDNVKEAMEQYFQDLDGHETSDLYDLVIAQVEKPLFEAVLKKTRGNMSKAAQLLGMNRGTLRNRLKKYGLEK